MNMQQMSTNVIYFTCYQLAVRGVPCWLPGSEACFATPPIGRDEDCAVSIVDIQDAQLSQRDRAAGCVTVFAKSRTLELGDNDLRTL